MKYARSAFALLLLAATSRSLRARPRRRRVPQRSACFGGDLLTDTSRLRRRTRRLLGCLPPRSAAIARLRNSRTCRPRHAALRARFNCLIPGVAAGAMLSRQTRLVQDTRCTRTLATDLTGSHSILKRTSDLSFAFLAKTAQNLLDNRVTSVQACNNPPWVQADRGTPWRGVPQRYGRTSQTMVLARRRTLFAESRNSLFGAERPKRRCVVGKLGPGLRGIAQLRSLCGNSSFRCGHRCLSISFFDRDPMREQIGETV